jgi:hypothetical protein
MDSEPTRSATAVRTDVPPTYWGDHDANPLQRLEPGWVVATWAWCMLASFGVAIVATTFAAIVADSPITGTSNNDLGLLTIVAAMSTFIGFAVVMTTRLLRVDHDRLVNSLAVAALHLAVALVLFLLSVMIDGFGFRFESAVTDDIANAFAVLERSSVAAILACLLASGMVPARGDRPAGTQVGATPQDRQL